MSRTINVTYGKITQKIVKQKSRMFFNSIFFLYLKCRFSIDVFEKSPEEIVRLKIQEEMKIAKETARKSRKGKIYYRIKYLKFLKLLLRQKFKHVKVI